MKKTLFKLDYLRLLKVIASFLGVYAAFTILIAIFARVSSVVVTVIIGLALVVIFGTSLAFALICFMYFAKSMYGEQGRFINTIPLKTSDVVFTKWLAIAAANFTMTVGQIVIIVITSLVSFGLDNTYDAFRIFLYAVMGEFPFNAFPHAEIVMPLFMLYSLFLSPFMFASTVVATISLANLPKFQRYPIAAPILIYLAGTVLYGGLSLLSMFLPASFAVPVVTGSEPPIATGVAHFAAAGIQLRFADPSVTGTQMEVFPLGGLILEPLAMVVLLIIAMRVADKKLRVR